MQKRNYIKYTETYKQLEKLCSRILHSGVSRILPNERILAEQLGSSRMTLRKAMFKAENNGLIRRENKITEVLSQKKQLSCFSKILFISTGHHNDIHLGAFRRLFNALKAEVEVLGGTLELLLTRLDGDHTKAREKYKEADLILLTVVSKNEYIDDLMNICPEKVIALSDPHLEQFKNYIALDNYAAGGMAAKALLEFGCHKPVFVDSGFDNCMFQKRFSGFTDYLKEIGISIQYKFPKTSYLHKHEICRKRLQVAVDKGFDGAFIASDEGIEFVTHDLFQQGLAPHKFKLMTLNGEGVSVTHSHLIPYVSHATDGVVREIIIHLKNIASGQGINRVNKLLKPRLYKNKSIETIKTKEVALC